MEIKIINEEDHYICFSNLTEISDIGGNKIIEGSLKVGLNEFSVSSKISLMQSAIEDFLMDIKKSYKKKKGVIKLRDLDERISIIIECEKSGDVYLRGTINNQLYTVKLDFDVDLDQSYLPNLIDQLQETILHFK